jgi:hypothetical protein
MRALALTLRLVVVCASLAAAPALAAPPAGGKEAASDDKEVNRSVELSGLVFPVFDEDGRLLNYLFVNSRMLVGPGLDTWRYRERAHFIRDAVIRAAHRTSFAVDGEPGKLDEEKAQAESLKAANEALGEPGAMVGMTFTQIASQAGG